jgi:DNA helicase-2/ATP-dependent DNA helicase PcrA
LIGEGASRFTLSQNRRCTEEILSAANTIVGFNKRSAPKRLSSGRHGAKVFATGHVTDINEAAWVAQQIEKLVASGVQPSQVAVLFRSKFAIPPFEEALARVGVPSIVMSGTSLLQREEIKDVVAFLRLALNDRDDVAFSRIANKPARGLGPVAVDTIISLSRSKGVGFHEVLQIASDETNEFGITKAARNGMRKLASALSFIQEDGRWNRPPFDVVTTVLTATGYSDWLQKQDNADVKIGYVEALHRLSESYEDLETFLADIALMSDVETSTEVQKGRVKLMTMHACKGLEFDHVFCAGFDEGVMPSSRAIDEYVFTKPGNPWVGPRGGGLEEERRLCHVAFTRARHSLTVSFPMRRAGIKGKMRATGPSFFLEECDLKWKEMPQMTAAELGRKNVRMNKKLTGYDR